VAFCVFIKDFQHNSTFHSFQSKKSEQLKITMPKRTSVKDVSRLEDLNELDRLVKDKRNEKRADAKKNRRNRHYVNLLIRHQLNHGELEDENE
jgi:hypothetical protein